MVFVHSNSTVKTYFYNEKKILESRDSIFKTCAFQRSGAEKEA